MYFPIKCKTRRALACGSCKKLGEENEKGLECVRIRLSVYIITCKYEEKKQEIIKSVLS